MGLLSQIETEIPTPADPPIATPAMPQAMAPTTGTPDAGRAPTAPCHRCTGRLQWLDPAGLWHCQQCTPPPAVPFVREQVAIVDVPGGHGRVPIPPEATAYIDLTDEGLGVWVAWDRRDGGRVFARLGENQAEAARLLEFFPEEAREVAD